MRQIAGWLTARPWNAVLGLALTLMLPFAQIVSGATMVLLVLAQGARTATLIALAAAAVLSGLQAVFGNPVPPLLINAALVWLPVALLAALLRQSRSITLTLQVSAIVAVLATVGFYVALGDPTAFWTAKLAQIATVFEQSGLTQYATSLNAQREMIAPQMTMVFVATSWSMIVLVTVMGYALFQQLPDRKAVFGRFSELSFGRVLAVLMAVTSLAAFATSISVLQNLAFVLLAIFWVQGAAVMHWLHSDGPLPFLAIVAMYALLPFLNALLVMGLAVLGYTDAWFGYRPRINAARRDREGPSG